MLRRHLQGCTIFAELRAEDGARGRTELPRACEAVTDPGMVAFERCFSGAALLGALSLVVSCGDSDDAKSAVPIDAGNGDGQASGGTGGAGGAAGSGAAGSSGSAGNPGGTGGTSAAGAGGIGGQGATSTDAGPEASTDAAADADAAPNPLDRWVDPVAGDDANDGTTPAMAFKQIDTALADTAAGGTLWLMDGTYSQTTGQPVSTGYNSLSIPDGVGVRAVNPGMVVMGEVTGAPPGFVFEGSGALSGVHFDSVPIPVKASAGVVALGGLSFAHAGGGCSSFDQAAIVLSGTVVATLTPDGVADYAGVGSDIRGFAVMSDSAQLTISGGTLTSLAGSICSPSTIFALLGSSRLTLDGVTVKDAQEQHRGGIISMRSATTAVTLVDSTFDGLTAGTGGLLSGAAVFVDGGAGSPNVTVTGTTIENLTGHPAIQLGYENGASTPIVEVSDSTFTANGYAIASNAGSAPAAPTVTLTNTQITASEREALYLGFGGSLSITGGAISGNGTVANAFGGIYVGGATGAYTVVLRGVAVTNNVAVGSNSGGVVLAGAAGSVFDLGKVGEPGGNTFTGDAQTGVRVNVAAGVTVFAVGNTWNASVQSAASAGTYSAVGAGATLDVTTGSGSNYTVSSGTLRLAENP